MRRVAVVTGGARGIGFAIARRLADDGYAVALWDLLGEALERALEGWLGDRDGVLPTVADVTDRDSVQAALDALLDRWGRVDALVNNAGTISHASIFELAEDEWRRTLDVNLSGVLRCSREVAPTMKAQHYGRIVNIASMAARTGGESSGVAYAASKAGVVGLTKALSRGLGPFGVTVNAVAPGIIDTPMIATMPQERRDAWTRAIPLRRLGTAEEVAGAVAFLVGPDSRYVTGTTLDVNGGYYVA